MNTRKFMLRLVIKIITFAIITTIIFTMLSSPIITNDIAMGQMENSDELYLIMEAYNKTSHFISIIYGCVTVFFAGTIIHDIYKFIQTKTKEKF